MPPSPSWTTPDVDDMVTVSGNVYWATGGANTVEGTDGLDVSIPTPVMLITEPTSTYLYVVSAETDFSQDIARVRLQDGSFTSCLTAGEIGGMVAVAGHLYFTTTTSTSWALYDLAE